VNVCAKVKKAGGLSFNSTVPLTKCSEKMAQLILHEYSIHHCAQVLVSRKWQKIEKLLLENLNKK